MKRPAYHCRQTKSRTSLVCDDCRLRICPGEAYVLSEWKCDWARGPKKRRDVAHVSCHQKRLAWSAGAYPVVDRYSMVADLIMEGRRPWITFDWGKFKV